MALNSTDLEKIDTVITKADKPVEEEEDIQNQKLENEGSNDNESSIEI